MTFDPSPSSPQITMMSQVLHYKGKSSQNKNSFTKHISETTFH